MNLLDHNKGNKVRNSSIGFISKSAPLVRDQVYYQLSKSNKKRKAIQKGFHPFLRYEHTTFLYICTFFFAMPCSISHLWFSFLCSLMLPFRSQTKQCAVLNSCVVLPRKLSVFSFKVPTVLSFSLPPFFKTVPCHIDEKTKKKQSQALRLMVIALQIMWHSIVWAFRRTEAPKDL